MLSRSSSSSSLSDSDGGNVDGLKYARMEKGGIDQRFLGRKMGEGGGML